ncbi:hypothetical protein V6N13_004132 [Hibiscus sabdariffa]
MVVVRYEDESLGIYCIVAVSVGCSSKGGMILLGFSDGVEGWRTKNPSKGKSPLCNSGVIDGGCELRDYGEADGGRGLLDLGKIMGGLEACSVMVVLSV